MTKKIKKKKEKEEVEKVLEEGVTQVAPSTKSYISTGSTLLNLAITGDPFKGFPTGKYSYIVGDSTSGKTFLCMTCMAEACLNEDLDDYKLVLDNIEDGMMFDIKGLFHQELADRLEPPAWDGELPKFSKTVQEFYYHIDDLVDEGQPFIYVLDSMDALTSRQDKKQFQEEKKAHRKGTKTSGSYGTSKASANSQNLREVVAKLRDTNSVLIIVSQTRDNLGFGHQKKTRAGGHALRFYATVEMWSSVKGKLTKTVRGKRRKVGVQSKIKIKKNRITGEQCELELPIYPSYGIDDVGSCVDYLMEEEWWEKEKNSIVAEEFDVKGMPETVIDHILENDLEDELRALVGKCWREIQEECALDRRKSKYE